MKLFTLLFYLIIMVSCHNNTEPISHKTPPTMVGNKDSRLGITGVNHKGDSIDFYKIKAQYILLDFWASWCKPCRQFNLSLVSLYNQYHDKGFEIMSVSLDEKEDKWKQAIAQDKLNWKYHFCDFIGWESPIATHYKIESIPHSILFDTKGNIVAENLSEEELGDLLNTLLK